MEKFLNRFGWLIVMAAALGFSTWSLYFIARHYGAPAPAAVVVSTFFDGAAVLCADYALKYARSGESAFIPQLGVFILAGLSAYLNSQHAILQHQISAARILYAAPPIVAVVIYEFHVRWERRRALRNSGRIPAAMPVFGRYAWFLFPVKTLRVMRTITAHRLMMIRATNTPMVIQNGSREFGETPELFPETPSTFALNPGQTDDEAASVALYGLDAGSPAAIRMWARTVGLPVSRRGPISVEVRTEYLAAMHQLAIGSGETPETETPAISGETPEPPDDSAPMDEMRRGYL